MATPASPTGHAPKSARPVAAADAPRRRAAQPFPGRDALEQAVSSRCRPEDEIERGGSGGDWTARGSVREGGDVGADGRAGMRSRRRLPTWRTPVPRTTGTGDAAPERRSRAGRPARSEAQRVGPDARGTPPERRSVDEFDGASASASEGRVANRAGRAVRGRRGARHVGGKSGERPPRGARRGGGDKTAYPVDLGGGRPMDLIGKL